MSAPLREAPLGDLPLPGDAPADNLVRGTALSRLAQAFRQGAQDPDTTPDATFSSSPASIVGSQGVPNPYGRGLAAYEPNTVIFADYATAHAATQASKAEEAAGEQMLTADFSQAGAVDYGGGGIVEAGGRVQTMISAAMNLAARRVPYVWGGTTANGVDCSGLIYYAAKAAGIDWQRYRAVDYGRMGQAVSLSAARPGDIVYFDNANSDTDHVGIYIGNGQMIQAPQSGDVVKVTGVGNFTSIRRVFTDGSFTAGATPAGLPTPLYNGRPYSSPSRGAALLNVLPRALTGFTSGPPTIRRTYDPRLLR